MITRYSSSPNDVKHYTTSELRDEFLVEGLFAKNELKVVYSHIDRVVAIGVYPADQALTLEGHIDPNSFGVGFFLERREMGIANIGGDGVVIVDGQQFELAPLDVLYVGQGAKSIEFVSREVESPARYYCLSTPAHQSYPTTLVNKDQAKQVELGDQTTINRRTINQYIHPDVIPSCQLSMGITHLQDGSAWNTMPCHTHERRMEAYFYFNIDENDVVFHFMGEPNETRHLVVQNQSLVLSPSWSIHSGCGTKNYSFIWGMAGENQTFDDMDFVENRDLR